MTRSGCEITVSISLVYESVGYLRCLRRLCSRVVRPSAIIQGKPYIFHRAILLTRAARYLRFQRSIVLVAFLVTAWIIASLALSGDVVQSTVPLPIGPLLPILSATVGDAALTLAIVLMSYVLYCIIRDRKFLADALRNLFSRRKVKLSRKSNQNLKRNIIGTILLIVILIAVRSARLLPQDQPSKGNAGSAGSTFIFIPGFDVGVFQSSLLAAYHFFAVWSFEIISLAIIMTSALIFLRAFTGLRTPETSPSGVEEAVTQEAFGIIEDSHRDLQEGDDFRRSILECYRRLCEVFEPEGRVSHKLLTARELRERMIEQLSGAVRPISSLTSLFEEARYSSHQISAEMRDSAVRALEEIEEFLRHPSENTLKAIQ